MLEKILGNQTGANVLLFLQAQNEGYASEIARVFKISLSMVQKQLAKFEEAGILVSQLKGRTRFFYWNPRCPFLNELKALLNRVQIYLPENERKRLFLNRRRPRRSGKPL